MIARFDWQIGGTPSRAASGPTWSWSHRLLGLLLAGLTAVFFLWLLFHHLFAADFALLPALLGEMVRLMEAAGLVTLAALWAVWLWQGRGPGRRAAAPAPPALSLAELYALSPAEFEQYVAHLFRKKGYKVSQRGRSGDQGVDLELVGRGGKRAIVQCKRYQRAIGPDVVRELYGTLVHEGVAHAFLVTTAPISDAARSWARGKPMTLIDGNLLVEVAGALCEVE
jgi:hypothetical protein